MKPMLDDIELQLVQEINVEEDQLFAQHDVPALEGDFLQGLGRCATRIKLVGVMTGPEAAQSLKTLRDKFRSAAPVSFVADIVTATRVEKVIIEEMGVRELAGKPERFEYELTLREFIPAPEPKTEQPPAPPPEPTPPIPPVEKGTLVIEVIVEGQPDFDFSTVTVTLEGKQDDGVSLSRNLTNHEDGVWTEQNMPPGSYTVRAVVTDPQEMSGDTQATVRRGQTTLEEITLRPGAIIAKAFIIHYRFDSAFIEPCLRQVLGRVIQYAQAHPNEKLLIVGHTDLVGDDDYNQALSERRARGVFAYLTFGTSDGLRESALKDWDNLRRKRLGPLANVEDNWGTREYQYMLQDLRYYSGNIDEKHGPNTDKAVRNFQSDHGLAVTGLVDDATWPVLIESYLDQDSFAMAESQFFANADDKGCDGGILRWLGCGEQDPVKNTGDAWRPNRRTELLFVRTDRLPCAVPPPVTFDLPEKGAVGSTWCLGPGNKNARACFLARKKPEPNKWFFQLAEPDKIRVSGTITFEDGTPVANEKYALIAPDGEFLHTDSQGKAAVGETAKGRPILNQTDAQGRFSHPNDTLVGVYILEMPELAEPQVARAKKEPPPNAIGNVVCMRLDKTASAEDKQGKAPAPAFKEIANINTDRGNRPGIEPTAAGEGEVPVPIPVPIPSPFQQIIDAIIHLFPPPPVPVDPVITLTPKGGSNVLVVAKSYTKPARKQIHIGVSSDFTRKGSLKRSSDAVLFFDKDSKAIPFNNKGVHEYSSAELNAGVELFAEARRPSTILNDFTLTLTLETGKVPPTGPPITEKLTLVELKLDISASRPAPGVPPPPLPQPPPKEPALGTAKDKWFGGRAVNAQDTNHGQERALLTISPPKPKAFNDPLVLNQVKVSGNDIIGTANQAQVFDNEKFTAGETPAAKLDSIILGGKPKELWVEGQTVSSKLREIGFQLGVKEVENDGDRVAVTVGVTPLIILASPVLVVAKSYTTPARKKVTVKTSVAFDRKGTLKRSSDAVRFFDAETGGAEIPFSATGELIIEGAELTKGKNIFAEARRASGNVDEFTLTLTLAPGATPPTGLPTKVTMTLVELTLDILQARLAPNITPAPLSVKDKIELGRFLHVRDSDNTQRAILVVRAPKPANFTGTLTLSPINNSVKGFSIESGSQALSDPHLIPTGDIKGDGLRLFAEGVTLSSSARDTGFRLGLQNVEEVADRVAINVILVAISNVSPFDVTRPRVQIEGVLSTNRSSFDTGDLFGNQADSLFCVRADLPGLAGNTAQARLTTNRGDGTAIESQTVTLTRRPATDRFVSRPILAVPQSTPQVRFSSPQTLEVARCRAGGTLRAQILTATGNVGAAQVRTRGRILLVSANIVSSSGVTTAEVNAVIDLGIRTWAQAGIEIRLSGPITTVTDPGGLDIIEALNATNFSNNLGTERQALYSLNPTSNIDLYFVRSAIGEFGEGFGNNDLNAPMAAFRGDMLVRRGTIGRNTFSHEIGHIIIDLDSSVNNKDEHLLFTVGAGGVLTSGGTPPVTNVMSTGKGVIRTDLTRDQCLRAFANPRITFDPP